MNRLTLFLLLLAGISSWVIIYVFYTLTTDEQFVEFMRNFYDGL